MHLSKNRRSTENTAMTTQRKRELQKAVFSLTYAHRRDQIATILYMQWLSKLITAPETMAVYHDSAYYI